MGNPLKDILEQRGVSRREPQDTRTTSPQDDNPLRDILRTREIGPRGPIEPVQPADPEAPFSYRDIAAREEMSKVTLDQAIDKSLADPNITPERRASLERIKESNRPSTTAAMGLVYVRDKTDKTRHPYSNIARGAGAGLVKAGATAADLALTVPDVLTHIPIIGKLTELSSKLITFAATGEAKTPNQVRREFAEAAASADLLFDAQGVEGYIADLGTQLVGALPPYSAAVKASAQFLSKAIPKIAPLINQAFTGARAKRIAGQLVIGAPIDALQISTMPDVSAEDKAKLFALAQTAQAIGAAVDTRSIREKNIGKIQELMYSDKPREITLDLPHDTPAAPASRIQEVEDLARQAQSASESRKRNIAEGLATRAEAKKAWEAENPGKVWKDLPKEERDAIAAAYRAPPPSPSSDTDATVVEGLTGVPRETQTTPEAPRAVRTADDELREVARALGVAEDQVDEFLGTLKQDVEEGAKGIDLKDERGSIGIPERRPRNPVVDDIVMDDAAVIASTFKNLEIGGYAKGSATTAAKELDEAMKLLNKWGIDHNTIKDLVANKYVADAQFDIFHEIYAKHGKEAVEKIALAGATDEQQIYHDLLGGKKLSREMQKRLGATVRSEAEARALLADALGIPYTDVVYKAKNPAPEVSSISAMYRKAGLTEIADNLDKFMEGSAVTQVQYHGTNRPFTVPRGIHTKSDLGFHVGTAQQAANRVVFSEKEPLGPARTIPIAVNIKNPLRLVDPGHWPNDRMLRNIQHKRILSDDQITRLFALYDQITKAKSNVKFGYARNRFNAELIDMLEKAGYDGVVYSNRAEGQGDSYFAFRPNQVKALLGNQTFSLDSPSMYGAAIRDMLGGLLLSSGGGLTGLATVPEDASEAEKIARAATGALLGGSLALGGSFLARLARKGIQIRIPDEPTPTTRPTFRHGTEIDDAVGIARTGRRAEIAATPEEPTRLTSRVAEGAPLVSELGRGSPPGRAEGASPGTSIAVTRPSTPGEILQHTQNYFRSKGIDPPPEPSPLTKYKAVPLDPTERARLEKVPPAMLDLENTQRLLGDVEARMELDPGNPDLVAQANNLRSNIVARRPYHQEGLLLYTRPEAVSTIGGFFAGMMLPENDEDRWAYAVTGGLLGFAAGRFAVRKAAVKKPPKIPKEVLTEIKTAEDLRAGAFKLPFSERMRQIYQNIVRPWHITEHGPLGVLTARETNASRNPRVLGAMSGRYVGGVEHWISGEPYIFSLDGTTRTVAPYQAVDANGKPILISNFTDLIKLVDGDVESLGKLAAAKAALQSYSQGGRGFNINMQDAINVAKTLPENYHVAVDALRYFHLNLAQQLEEIGRFAPGTIAQLSFDKFYTTMERKYGSPVGLSKTKGGKGTRPSIRNPVESFVNQLANTMRAAEVGMMKNYLVDHFDAAPEVMQLYMRRIDKNRKGPDGKPIAETEATLRRVDELRQDLNITKDEAEALDALWRTEPLSPEHPTMSVWRDGHKRKYLVDKGIDVMLQSYRPPEFTFFGSVALGLASFLRAGIVNDPVFITWMAIRDQFQAMVNTQYGYRPGIDGVKGFLEIWNRGPEYQAYTRQGGGHPALAYQDVITTERAVRTARAPGKTAGHQALAAIRELDVAAAWRALTVPLAESARMGEYLRARGRGASPIEATFAARQVVGNLQQIGTSARALSLMTPFLRASIQAFDQTVFMSGLHPFRGAPEILGGKPVPGSEAQRRLWAARNYAFKTIAGITIPSILLWAANKDDEEIEQMRRAEGGNRFWFFRVPVLGVVKVPKPIFEGQVFGTTAEFALDKMLDDDPVSMRNWIRAVKDDATFNLIPTIGAVPFHLAADRDPLTNAPISPRDMAAASPQYWSRQSNSTPSRVVGDGLGPISRWVVDKGDPGLGELLSGTVARAMSPAGLDYLLRNVGGPLRYEAIRGVGVAIEAIQEHDIPPAQEWPIVRRALVRFPTTSTASLQQFYDDAEQINRIARDAAILAENDPVGLVDHLKQYGREMSLVDLYVRTRNSLADWRQSIEDLKQATGNKLFSNEAVKAYEEHAIWAMIREAQQVNLIRESIR